jgi:hypothetical protein
MDLGKALSYLFADPKWLKKLLLAAFVSVLPVLGQIILIGWLLDTLRNIRAGQPYPIPEWSGDDLARWLGRGVAAWVSVMAWILPCALVLGIIFTCGSFGLQVLTGGAMSAVPSGGQGAGSLMAGLGTVYIIVLCCFSCVAVLALIIVVLGAMVPYIRFAVTDRMDVGLDYRANFRLLFANIGPFLLILLVAFVALIVVGIVNVITLGIGTFVTTPYISLVFTYLFAGISRRLETA